MEKCISSENMYYWKSGNRKESDHVKTVLKRIGGKSNAALSICINYNVKAEKSLNYEKP